MSSMRNFVFLQQNYKFFILEIGNGCLIDTNHSLQERTKTAKRYSSSEHNENCVPFAGVLKEIFKNLHTQGMSTFPNLIYAHTNAKNEQSVAI